MQAQTLRSLEDIFIDLRDALDSDSGAELTQPASSPIVQEEEGGEEIQDSATPAQPDVDETETLRKELAAERARVEKLQQRLDDMRREAVLDRERFMRVRLRMCLAWVVIRTCATGR